MMISLLARRLTTGVAARSAHAAPFSPVARRTLFATPRFHAPAEETPGNPAEKKATKGKAPAKKGSPSKKTKSEKPSKENKQRVRVPANLKPPKRAPGAYFLFYASFLRTQPKPVTIEDCQAIAKRAGEVWRGYSMAEKQPFYDENEARKMQAKQEREEFFDKTSPSDLKQLNAIRKAQGKFKVHTTKKPNSNTPVTPFISFSNEFRNSPEGQVIINETSPEKSYSVRAVIAAGERWRSMSKEEKEPYFERFEQAKKELKAEAEQTQS